MTLPFKPIGVEMLRKKGRHSVLGVPQMGRVLCSSAENIAKIAREARKIGRFLCLSAQNFAKIGLLRETSEVLHHA